MANAKAEKNQAGATKLDAPGLEWRDRAGGKRVPIWVAARKAVKDGYRPSSRPLDASAPLEAIAATCRSYQADLLAWIGSADKSQRTKVEFDGTVRSLIGIYETHPQSPINLPYDPADQSTRGVKHSTKDNYLQYNGILFKAVGEVTLRDIAGPDLGRWYDNFVAPEFDGGPKRVARGKQAMGQFVRLIKFGVFMEIEGCLRIAVILTGSANPNGQRGLGTLRFPNARRRTQELTREQVVAFCDTVAKRRWDGAKQRRWTGTPSASMALATVLQFETMQRQTDIIGEWVPVKAMRDGALVRDGYRWVGLTWGVHLDPVTLVYRKPTSKSREHKTGHADLTLSPMAQALLAAIPPERRIGPVIINETTGLPYQRKAFHTKWRRIATEAGIPKEVQNRDARAGALTEADDAGVAPGQSSRQAVHGKLDMTRSYQRESLENARAVMRKRVAFRHGGGE